MDLLNKFLNRAMPRSMVEIHEAGRHLFFRPRCPLCRRESDEGRPGHAARERERAREYMRAAAAADTHSSDVEPGRVDPWEER